MRLLPQNVQLIGNELGIVWNDGQENYYGLEHLRRMCPCAGCGGEPDVMGRVEVPDVRYTVSSFQLRRWQVIGGYALQLNWGDGHGSGLYSFDYLRKLAAVSS